MTATIIDLAARREARDAAEHEVEYYGILQYCPGGGVDFFAEMKSGGIRLLAVGLSAEEAMQRLMAATNPLQSAKA